jgi:hypothetical protein
MAFDVIDKLKKMINHEQSARSIGNIAEAEAFAAKITSFLFENKLSMSDIEIAEEAEEPVGREDLVGDPAPWAGVLLVGVTAATFTRAINIRSRYVVVGRPSDRQAAAALYNYLVALGKSLADTATEAFKQTYEYERQKVYRPRIAHTWKVSFLKGYASSLQNRLNATVKQLTANAQSAGTGLVHINKTKEAVDNFVTGDFGRLRGDGKVRSNHAEAYNRGYQAGSSVSLNGRGALGAGA